MNPERCGYEWKGQCNGVHKCQRKKGHIDTGENGPDPNRHVDFIPGIGINSETYPFVHCTWPPYFKVYG